MSTGRNKIVALAEAWRSEGRHGVVLEWLAEETAKAHRYAPDETVSEAMSALLELARAAAEPEAKDEQRYTKADMEAACEMVRAAMTVNPKAAESDCVALRSTQSAAEKVTTHHACPKCGASLWVTR